MKKLLSLFIALVMICTLLAGCGQQAPATEPEKTPEQSVPATDWEYGSITNNEDGTRTVVDMAGRSNIVPGEINSVYCAVPTGEAMVWTLFPDKLIGWVNAPSEASLAYLPENLANLPVIGGWMGQQVTANMEDIIKLNPDVIIYMGTKVMSNTDTTPDQIQEQTGIPVVVVSSELEYTAYVYRFLGVCLDATERGEMLAAYCEKVMGELSEAMTKVPEEKKVSVYYAEGQGGLATEPSGSNHVQVLDFIGVKNVAEVEMKGGQGMTEVSIEQVINWNPDVILVSGSTASNYEEILKNTMWSQIKAVQDGKVYVTPTVPFNWFDRPPNIMRVLGMQWFADVIYPNYVDYDVNTNIKEFFKTFYNVELSDAEVTVLLAPNA